MARIDVQAVPRDNAACPYCRDGLQEPLWTCPGCEVVYHQACRAELGRCATLGCAAPAIVVRAPGAEQAAVATTEAPVAVDAHLIGPLQLVLLGVLPVLVVLSTAYATYTPASLGFLGPAFCSLLISGLGAFSLALLTRLGWVPRGHRLRALGQSLRAGLIGAVVAPILILLLVVLPQVTSSSGVTLGAISGFLAGAASLGLLVGFAARLTAILAPHEADSVLAELNRSRSPERRGSGERRPPGARGTGRSRRRRRRRRR